MFIVADFNYIETINGWIYTAFIIHMPGCSIVGWKVSNDMKKYGIRRIRTSFS